MSREYPVVYGDFSSLVEILRWRAVHQSDQEACTFLLDGETEEVCLTYRELDQWARSIAALLQQQHIHAGERVLLLFPPGPAYMAAFWGCLYTGVVAVPAYPPRQNRHLARVETIVADAQASIALTSPQILSTFTRQFMQNPCLNNVRWVSIDRFDATTVPDWQAVLVDSATTALIQYTSGSTGTPKGVMLTHGNLLANSACILQALEPAATSRGVSWLPPFHDLGLIGGIIQPIYSGFPITLLSPTAFLQRPLRWLQAIAQYRGTFSGGPNFAYDLCVQRFDLEQCANLDLSSWEVAFSGAEPINPDTLQRFARTFEPFGFRRQAFALCYGLAEATLVVSCVKKAELPMLKRFDSVQLERHQVVASPAEDESGRLLAGCGRAFAGQEVRIVDPQTRTLARPGTVGEIWISGPSIATGYWAQPEETAVTFRAWIEETGEGPFLRTGDLGFLFADELFITGRLKDVIIIRGRNHYPQDIEATVQRSHPMLRPGSGAAFAVEINGEEQLVVAQEVERQHRAADVHTVATAIRQAVAEQHHLQVFAVVLLKVGGVPKTSSGKVQRQACRVAFLAGQLEVLESSQLEPFSRDQEVQPVIACVTRETLNALPDDEARQLLTMYLRGKLGEILRNGLTRQIDAELPLSAAGLDSLAAIHLQYTLEETLAVRLPMVDLFQMSIDELVSYLQAGLSGAAYERAGGTIAPLQDRTQAPLSHGQQALWFLHQLAPESSAYNLARAIRLSFELDASALERAFQTLVERHAVLRTTFVVVDGQPVQRIDPADRVSFSLTDVADMDKEDLQARLVHVANQPFDLEGGPLLKVYLYRQSPREHVLLVVVHHSIADFWSLALLAHELSVLYSGTSWEALPPLPLAYTDYVRWQRELLAGPRGEQLWTYWRTQLGGELPVLDLPTDRPRPAVQTYRGAAEYRKLGRTLTGQIKHLSSTSQCTLFITLLAAFQVLLYRYTGQTDILVGSPTAGRSQAALAGIVGYFVNPLVLRTRFARSKTFVALLQQVRQTVLEAFEHQDYPFALLAERLQQVRDPGRTPLFQVMFAFQQAPLIQGYDLTGFALDEAQARLTLGTLPLESVALPQQTAQFDLTLAVVEMDGELHTVLQYNTDLFEAATIQRMLEHFQVLLDGIVASPETPVELLPVLTPAERQRLLDLCSAAAGEVEPQCIHTAFEAMVQQTPDAIALVFQDEQISYRELNRRADRLAAWLCTLGVGPDVAVGICISRSPALLIAMLAILKSGGAYLPLDGTYPAERLSFMIQDARLTIVITERELAAGLPLEGVRSVYLDEINLSEDAELPVCVPSSTPANLAYIIYTSGSTGKPKGVMVQHNSVSNFLAGMDRCIGLERAGSDVLLAVTSVSFDISALELWWTLTRGMRVVLLAEQVAGLPVATRAGSAGAARTIDFSLFYFASDTEKQEQEKYRLLIEGAKFADRHAFSAVWTPERHFHAFGGLYPNPSVTSAALAMVTERIQLRAGSVVLPLHNPLRIVEEWSVVDNLSRGRVGIAFASGWQANDFVFYPENYASRKAILFAGIETVQKLWRGESITVQGGAGNQVTVSTLPRPLQAELPVWITAAGNPDTFISAGRMGARVLTHLLGQTLEEVAEKIRLYRQALQESGHRPEDGHVTLMLHTFLGEDKEVVRARVREPFMNYLRTSVDLIANLIKSLALPLDLKTMSEQDLHDLLAFAFERYFETSALFGTLDMGREMIHRLKAIDVDEVACLIDFGVAEDEVLASLSLLNELKEISNVPETTARYTLADLVLRERPTLLQCTPSLMRLYTMQAETLESLTSLRALLLGGEALPAALAAEVRRALPGRLINMYGPTETTVWSAAYDVADAGETVPIGFPILNTRLYILDRYLQLLPAGVPGEIYIAGAGLARGYFERPGVTAERFVPDPLSTQPGARMYRTGDLARAWPDGTIEYLGRSDYQVKIRGHRIELEEIEAVLNQHPQVREAVALVQGETLEDRRLVACFVPAAPPSPEHDPAGLSVELKELLKARLPDYMVPAHMIPLDALPLTLNGKIDRNALRTVRTLRLDPALPRVEPANQIERTLAELWRQVLQVEYVGVHDNFFDLGGHSLLVVQVHSQLKQISGQDIPLVRLLEYPTISSLARYLGQNQREQPAFQASHERARKQMEGFKRQRQRAQRGVTFND